MNRYFIIGIFISITNLIYADDLKVYDNLHRVNLDVLGVEYAYENALSDSFTWYNSAGLLHTNIDRVGLFHHSIIPDFCTELRFYYNHDVRTKIGYNTLYNSSDFFNIGLRVLPSLFLYEDGEYFPISTKGDKDYDKDYVREDFSTLLMLKISWGVQRTLWGCINYEFNISANFYESFIFYSGASFLANLKLGYVWQGD